MKRFASASAISKLLVFIMLIVGVSGCMFNKKDSFQQQAQDYLSEKYGEQFTYLDTYGSYSGTDVHEIYFSSQKYSNAEITVQCVKNGSEYEFTDNYLSIRFAQRTDELLRSIIDDLFGSNYFYLRKISRYGSSEKVTDFSDFSQYIADPSSDIVLTAIVSCEVNDTEAMERRIMDALQRSGIRCKGTIYFDPLRTDFSDLSEANYEKEYLMKATYQKMLVITLDNGNYRFRWR